MAKTRRKADRGVLLHVDEALQAAEGMPRGSPRAAAGYSTGCEQAVEERRCERGETEGHGKDAPKGLTRRASAR